MKTFIFLLAFIVLICLPFFLEEGDRIKAKKTEHIHTVMTIPFNDGFKQINVGICLTDSSMINFNGDHHNKERALKIIEYNNNIRPKMTD